MDLHQRVYFNIKQRIESARQLQKEDGTWRFCFEGSVMTDSLMIIMLRTLKFDNEALIQRLSNRLIELQEMNGAWKSYEDENDGDLSATIQAYSALLFSGYRRRTDEQMKKAEKFILQNGGLSRAHFMTKWILAVNGQYPWPKGAYVPPSILLLPSFVSPSFFNLSTYARIHFVPMMIPFNKRFIIRTNQTPNLDHLLTRTPSAELSDWLKEEPSDRSVGQIMKQLFASLKTFPSYINQAGYNHAEQYILRRIEADGTLYSYASATFFMIYALLALSYEKRSPVITQAISGLEALVFQRGNFIHVENSTSTVWDTALISYALQQAGVPSIDPMIQKSVRYLLSRQQTTYGDWAVHAPHLQPGGWGFSDINTINPDNDDTSAALRALTYSTALSPQIRRAWQKGTQWLLGMQNKDGGWGAFEKNAYHPLLARLPLENAEDAAVDPSTADLTGRVLEFLGNFAGLKTDHPKVKKAVDWLLEHQEKNGSWYGRWGVCYIYGTWAAITGLRAVGVSSSHPQVQKAARWLQSIQQQDGGWGESCQSCEVKNYVPLTYSTPSQTAWAVDALLSIFNKDESCIKKGVSLLSHPHAFSLQQLHYPTGIGLPDQFYIRYHSYHIIFPLLTLARYIKTP